MNPKTITYINIAITLLFAVSAVITGRVFALADSETGGVESTTEQPYHAPDLDWAFYLINEQSPLPADYQPALKAVSGDFALDERAADYAVAMLLAAHTDGVKLKVISAYRSMQKQGENFNSYVERLMAEDFSEDEAIALTAAQIAMPGASEHNAGLALDILSIYCTAIDEEFERTPEFRWLADNSWRFGFILRYPKDAEEITGFIYEPWHFRFVGVIWAEQIYNSGLTLDEYIASR